MQRRFALAQRRGERRHMRQPSGTSAPQEPHVDGLEAFTTWKVPQASALARVGAALIVATRNARPVSSSAAGHGGLSRVAGALEGLQTEGAATREHENSP